MFFEYDFSFLFKAWVRGCFLYFLLWLRCWYSVCTVYKSCAGDVGKVELSGWRRPCWAKGTRALPVAQCVEGVIRSFYLWCDPPKGHNQSTDVSPQSMFSFFFSLEDRSAGPRGNWGCGCNGFQRDALRDSLLCLLPWSSSSLLTSLLNRTLWWAIWDSLNRCVIIIIILYVWRPLLPEKLKATL